MKSSIQRVGKRAFAAFGFAVALGAAAASAVAASSPSGPGVAVVSLHEAVARPAVAGIDAHVRLLRHTMLAAGRWSHGSTAPARRGRRLARPASRRNSTAG